MPAQKKTGMVQQQWRLLLKEMEKVSGRRLKGQSRQTQVEIVFIRSQGIEAKVRWMAGGSARKVSALKIPVIDWWESYRSQVAAWLSRRPDWQADFLAGVWNEEFLEFVDTAGLKLFPGEDYLEKLQKDAICSCSVPDKPCVHMMAVLELMMQQMEADPGRALEYVGLSFPALMDEAHALTAKWFRSVYPSVQTTVERGKMEGMVERGKMEGIVERDPAGQKIEQGLSEPKMSGLDQSQVERSPAEPGHAQEAEANGVGDKPVRDEPRRDEPEPIGRMAIPLLPQEAELFQRWHHSMEKSQKGLARESQEPSTMEGSQKRLMGDSQKRSKEPPKEATTAQGENGLFPIKVSVEKIQQQMESIYRFAKS